MAMSGARLFLSMWFAFSWPLACSDSGGGLDAGDGGYDADGGTEDGDAWDGGGESEDGADAGADTDVPKPLCASSSFDWQGIPRAYIVCTPDPLPAGRLPVVLAFHGGSGNAAQWRQRTHWDEHGAANGYVTVFLQGCKLEYDDCSVPDKNYEWNVGKVGGDSTLDDQGYVREVLKRLETIHGLAIDAQRVFAVGHSLGGIFTYSLACDNPALLRAIGPISAPPSDATCTPHGGTSIHHVHGTADENVPFDTGCCSAAQKLQGGNEYLPACAALPTCYNPKNWWPPVRSGVHPFMTVTGLDAMATEGLGCRNEWEMLYQEGVTTCWRYRDCPSGTSADVCLVSGIDHKLSDLLDTFDIRGWLWQRFAE
jgi:pimeloyl-ACP methyl ester carboxylesterase